MKTMPRMLVSALCLAGFAQAAAAVDFHWAGFATVAVACFSGDDADYVAYGQPDGPGRSRRCDAGTDSLLGVQLDAEVDDRLSLALQMVADQDEDGHYDPRIEVAQLRWRVDDKVSLRLGRMPAPAFLFSETRQVRFAQPWVRPPQSVYGLVPVHASDGVELIVNNAIGGWYAEWQFGWSEKTFEAPLPNSSRTASIDSRGGFLYLTLDSGGTRLKVGYGYNETTLRNRNVTQLLGGLRTFSSGARLADDLEVEDSPMHSFALGAQHESAGWLLLAEAGYISVDGYPRDQFGAYVTVGRHFGAWMPYLSFEQRKTYGDDTDPRAGPLRAQVDTLLAATRYDGQTVSAGLSRALGDSAMVKLQIDRVQPDNDSWGQLSNHGPGYRFDDPQAEWLATLSLDFVF